MNSRQRSSRYGFALHFAVGATSAVLLAASLVRGMPPFIENAIGAALLVILFLHARMGFALGRMQNELEIMRRLSDRAASSGKASSEGVAKQLLSVPAGSLSASEEISLTRVRDAIEAGRIDLYLQPIVSLPQRKARFYEAFSRLRDVDGKLMKPTDYLAAAESANKIGVIDNMILMRCIQALREERNRAPRLAVFCNLSPATIYDEEFFNQLTDYLESNSDLASGLIFEFTYPAIQTMHPRVLENLSAIASRGSILDRSCALDRSGLGISARSQLLLRGKPANLLLAASRGDEASVSRLMSVRKRLSDAGVDLIAEKIEFENHMPEILSLGIDYGQGNLFGAARRADFYLGAQEPADSGDKAAA
ncbi:MAG: EAL domain-containing protein [Parvularculaceae bacterium]